jgi:hypothetical protein
MGAAEAIGEMLAATVREPAHLPALFDGGEG